MINLMEEKSRLGECKNKQFFMCACGFVIAVAKQWCHVDRWASQIRFAFINKMEV